MLLAGVYLFAIQIYCDFSGYSDIARGVSRLFGIELMVNFRQPYFSENVTEFWRRWHISLSAWLRDYLYIPLGGNRKGRRRTYINLMLTMLLGGLWHGAAWTFVVWGGLHGLYLAVHKLLTGNRKIGLSIAPGSLKGWIVKFGKIMVTFHLICLAWVFFRAENFSVAWAYLAGIAELNLAVPKETIRALLIAAFYVPLIALIDYNSWKRDSELPIVPGTHWGVRGLLYAAGVLLLLYVGTPDVVPFIYFQF